ncbi:MAG TPA: Free methionine-(R)-sulfoxide reductase, partial [Glaciecola sp.]|nr:Free methionine-(R)-sulfoxide reductase [Glaciecola sp.]
MTNYDTLNQQALALLGDEPDLVANLANISSLLFNELSDINWAGFYLYKDAQLVLGPFQGRPACIRIPMGKGVCGTAAQTLTIQR